MFIVNTPHLHLWLVVCMCGATLSPTQPHNLSLATGPYKFKVNQHYKCLSILMNCNELFYHKSV